MVWLKILTPILKFVVGLKDIYIKNFEYLVIPVIKKDEIVGLAFLRIKEIDAF